MDHVCRAWSITIANCKERILTFHDRKVHWTHFERYLYRLRCFDKNNARRMCVCVYMCARFSREYYRYFIFNWIWRRTFLLILTISIEMPFDSDSFHNSVLFTRPGIRPSLKRDVHRLFLGIKRSISSRYWVTNTKEVIHYLPGGFRRTRSRMSFLSTFSLSISVLFSPQ